jgi:predicted transcriptional regulator of viral defense system
MRASQTTRLLRLAAKTGAVRSRDLATHGIARQYLCIAEKRGLLTRVSRGIYVAKKAKITEHHSLVEASKRVPKGVICLVSALRFHDLTTQSPFEVWMAIGQKGRTPKLENPRLRIVRFSPETLRFGVATHRVEGIDVPVFTPAKTVADCFKFRHKIGLDVALEALREASRQKKASMDELWEAAKICRVANVMRPYLESLR